MSKNKTNETEIDVNEFIKNVEIEKRRTDAFALFDFFKSITNLEPKILGPTIIGFGKYHYNIKAGMKAKLL